ncbi:TonB-dependent receptor [Arenibacter certesii]|uniref:TonB-dependent receptor n=1 Tax=Arenibacter certesii TaxID=228955 RepID=A0A918IN99_9FLAO|nr:carboxypeptidase-like regulatory domain-containing protein [Arenibacter certesii]GGW23636.1 TonB-dependent receptor [Arenibacter certesii]
MPKRHNYAVLLIYVYLFLSSLLGKAQVDPQQTVPLIAYIGQLEQGHNVKFSYIDSDIRPITITVPSALLLTEILANLERQTNLRISKLNNRYYTIVKNPLVNICGILIDNFENNTIPSATVEVLGTIKNVITDANGKFYLSNIPKDAHLVINHLGYKTKYFAVDALLSSPPCREIKMVANYEQLNEVVVYQFFTTGINKEQDASITLNTGKIGILPGLIEPDVLQTIQALPGIKSVDETVSDINVRGGTNDQNLILWDGIKMYQSGHFFGLISAFNPYIIEEVTLIKNGTSAEYGDGVSSVISIQTENKIKQNFVGGAGFNLLSGDVFGHLPLSDKITFQFSGRRSTTDFVKTPTYDRFFEKAFQDSEVAETNSAEDANILTQNENFYFYDVSAKILYDITNKHKARLSFIHINNDLNYNETTENDNQNSNLKQNNLSFGGSLESNWTSRFKTHLNLYYTKYNLDAQNITSESQQLFQNNQVLEKALKLTSQYKLYNTLQWLNGYQLNETGIINHTLVTQPSFKSSIKGVIVTHSLFSQLAFNSLNSKWFARGGMRLNYITDLKTFDTFDTFSLEPRLNASYAINPNLKVEMLGEFKSQTTNQIIDLEQNFLGIEKRRWILSNEETLPITKSKQASLGLNYDRNSLYIGLEGFYKKVDGVSTATQGFQNKDQFNGEIGSYDVSGLEFLINKKTKLYSTWLSYTYNYNNYYFEDLVPHKFPNNLDIRHTFTFAGTYTINDFKVGLGANYRTGKPYTQPLEGDIAIDNSTFPNRINYAEPNSRRLSYYLRADASFIYHFQLGNQIRASVGASVLNILNKKNILNTYYRLNDKNEIETIKQVSLGVTPNFSFRLNF